jgi:succinate dehydrogenase/fumarate reductase flavoprotein subunit
MGNALVGRLLLSLRKRGVTLLMRTEATALHRGADGVDSVTLRQQGVTRRVRVRGGVVLASGGFNRDLQKRRAMLPGVDAAWCPGAPGHTGSAHLLAEAVGAHYGSGAMSHAFWAPVSIRKRADGSTAAFPHFVFDRAKPGMVTVNAQGRRFLNESTSYHLFGIEMQKAGAVPAFLVTDAEGMRKYGLGMVRPGGMGLRSALADGYVTQGATLEELAARLGLPAANLRETVTRFNGYWREGKDLEFGRGTTAYQRANGDAKWAGPNPSLGPVEKAPFYALRLYPGDIGAATGLVTDAVARVQDRDGQIIPGLYAVGNDMQSAMGGVYPAPGITIGPGLVFAYLAAKDAVARSRVEIAAALPA